ncbi:MAG: 16S rRNA (cytidine(1402)-2'-O)-methyltransferase [Eubacterium sp.]|nr:16S rRNA (cytidine(1402)-2'-O)-methyltransferase [Eubacterium sp.]
MAGTLYICGTPIGNLEDMTYRAVRVLAEADIIAAEDTRNSIKLLNHFDIHTPLTSYHEFNKTEKAEELCDRLAEGRDIALITDAGMPAVSDPGEELVAMAAERGFDIRVVPGPTACVSALAVSGLPTGRFAFEAFLPKDKKKRESVLESLRDETRTIIMYEAPHHLIATLKELGKYLGADRRIALCRELTKVHEEALRTTIGEALVHYDEEAPRGEFVLVIEGRSFKELEEESRRKWDEVDIKSHVEMYEKKGMDHKAAMKQAATDRGVPKREIYNALHKK